MKRIGFALLSGVAALSLTGAVATASDVTVNLDALGKPDAAKPEPSKKPAVKSPPARPDAVRSEIVPDEEGEAAAAPAAVKPQLSQKPPARPVRPKPPLKTAAPKKPAQGEIDFIAKTKRKTGETSAPVEASAPPAQPVQAAPLSPPADIALDPPSPAAAPAAMALPAAPAATALPAATPAKPAAPKPVVTKPQPVPATVKVDTGALDAQPHAGTGSPTGTPLTSIAPDGVLYIPKNVDALPKPVAVPAAAPAQTETEEASEPLTLPPVLPEAPSPASATPATVASIAPVAAPAAAASATLARASVLTGYATASELRFEAGQDALTPDAQASLDQLSESLKAAGMRVQLAAYSGPPGNNSSDARRLSLKRALAVREYLAGQGVQKLMVNIVALGGPATGATDRVDVMVRADQLSRATGQ
jgi:outer membrane protein OmpA-like peptidoglycan-associated protein